MAWTQEQLAGAGQFMQQNLDNPAVIRQRAGELGLSASDLLQAARTVNPDISQSQVSQFMGGPWAASGGGAQQTRSAAPVQAPTLRGYERSPYLDQMAQGITMSANRNLQEQILPGVRSNAIAAGGFGGSRQGIAEGLAIGRTSDAIASNLSNLYNTDYQQSQNRNLQQYQADQGFNLGLGQLDAQNRGIDNQFALGQRGMDLQSQGLENQYTLGLGNLDVSRQQAQNQRYGIDQTYSLGMTNADNNRYGTDKQYEVGMAGVNAQSANASAAQTTAAGNLALNQQQLGINTMLGLLDRQNAYNSNGITMGTNIQNTPMGYYQQFTNTANGIGNGFGTQTQSGGGSDPLMGAAGLARVGQSWLGNSNGMAANGGFGTGNAYGNQDLGAYL